MQAALMNFTRQLLNTLLLLSDSANLNWVNGWMAHEDSEYFFSSEKLSFADARSFCLSEGGALAELGTDEEDRTVALLVAILRKNGTVPDEAQFLIGKASKGKIF